MRAVAWPSLLVVLLALSGCLAGGPAGPTPLEIRLESGPAATTWSYVLRDPAGIERLNDTREVPGNASVWENTTLDRQGLHVLKLVIDGSTAPTGSVSVVIDPRSCATALRIFVHLIGTVEEGVRAADHGHWTCLYEEHDGHL